MDAHVKSNTSASAKDAGIGELKMIYFTDPLCCWSWGMQPHIDGLQSLYSDNLQVEYVMGGMLPSWDKFHDEVNSVSRPVQMGPVWMHAAQLTGRPINHLLWVKDPPGSSYPACIAVKCAQQQSGLLGIEYFKRVQEAAMVQAKNVASWHELEVLAHTMGAQTHSFDVDRFIADYKEETAIPAFRSDLALASQFRINRFPTIIIQARERKPILIPGYRTIEEVTRAIEEAFAIRPQSA